MVAATEKTQANGKENGALEVNTVCSFCGVGCGLTLTVEDGVIQKVAGEKGNPTSKGEACIKGREGWRYMYSDKGSRSPSSAKTANSSRRAGERRSTSSEAR